MQIITNRHWQHWSAEDWARHDAEAAEIRKLADRAEEIRLSALRAWIARDHGRAARNS